jgi:phosphoribosyl 1,2-cyclic phosphodiesterase
MSDFNEPPVSLRWNADDTVTTTIRTIRQSQTENREEGMQWMQDHITNYIEQQIKNHMTAQASAEVIDALDAVRVYLKGVQ